MGCRDGRDIVSNPAHHDVIRPSIDSDPAGSRGGPWLRKDCPWGIGATAAMMHHGDASLNQRQTCLASGCLVPWVPWVLGPLGLQAQVFAEGWRGSSSALSAAVRTRCSCHVPVDYDYVYYALVHAARASFLHRYPRGKAVLHRPAFDMLAAALWTLALRHWQAVLVGCMSSVLAGTLAIVAQGRAPVADGSSRQFKVRLKNLLEGRQGRAERPSSR